MKRLNYKMLCSFCLNFDFKHIMLRLHFILSPFDGFGWAFIVRGLEPRVI